MKFIIERTTQFKKDFKVAERQGLNMDELQKVILMLANGKTLSEEYRDHELKGKYAGYRECHIEPDWLLIYKITEKVLVLSLVRTGSHSRLFKK